MKNKVERERKHQGMSQQKLAELAKIGRSTISNIETERYTPRVDVALRIARALGSTVEELFGEEVYCGCQYSGEITKSRPAAL